MCLALMYVSSVGFGHKMQQRFRPFHRISIVLSNGNDFGHYHSLSMRVSSHDFGHDLKLGIYHFIGFRPYILGAAMTSVITKPFPMSVLSLDFGHEI